MMFRYGSWGLESLSSPMQKMEDPGFEPKLFWLWPWVLPLTLGTYIFAPFYAPSVGPLGRGEVGMNKVCPRSPRHISCYKEAESKQCTWVLIIVPALAGFLSRHLRERNQLKIDPQAKCWRQLYTKNKNRGCATPRGWVCSLPVFIAVYLLDSKWCLTRKPMTVIIWLLM